MSAAILFHLGLAGYAVATAMYLAFLLRPNDFAARVGGSSLFAGFVFHGIAVGLRIAELTQGGSLGFAEGLSLLGFLTVGSYLLVMRVYRMPVIGAFVSPLVLALLIPAHVAPGIEVPLISSISGVVMPVHVAVALGGIALFALGFGVALMYLLLERELKAKRLGTMFRRLPPLDLLDRLTYKLVVVGFVLLSITVVTGALFSQMEFGRLADFGAKQSFAFLAWVLTGLVIGLRQTVGWRGRRVAWATMAGFALVSFAYVGVFLRGAP